MASPFHAASALPSRAGWGRVARRSSRRARASASRLATSSIGPVEDGRELVVGRDPGQDRHPLPVALVGHAVRGGEEVGGVAQHLPDLGGAPGEGQAFDPVGVGVLARGERAVLGRQLAQHVVEGGPGDVAVARVAGEAPGVDVDPGELGVVVEHLLEVRHEPLGVGRVAVEPAAELVAHPAVGHRVQRAPRDHAAVADPRSRRPGAARTRSSSAAGTSARGPSRRWPSRRTPRWPPSRRRGDRPWDRPVRPRSGPGRPGPPPAARPPPRPRHAPRATRGRHPRAPGGTRASRGAARPGSTCRRRTAGRPGSGRPTSASRRRRSSTGRPPCRPGRGRAAPRGRP